MFRTVTQLPPSGSQRRARSSAPGGAIAAGQGSAGFGMVSALLALSLLAVFALVAAAVAVNERRSALNEELHTGAFMSADSGGEAAINWLRARDQPPAISNMATLQVGALGETTLRHSQRYEYQINMTNMPGNPRGRIGYSPSYQDFFYDINSRGEDGLEGQSNVGMQVMKLTRLGY